MATIDAEQAAITRRQKIAEMMMEQGQQPLETNNVAGGYVVPVSPLAGIGKVIQQMSGAYLGKKADEQQTALHDKKLADLSNIDISAPDLSSQLMKRGMVTEALAAQKDSSKVHREGIPSGFTATDNGGIAPMPMPGGSDYGKFLLEQAAGKAQIPSYGEPQKLQMAQQDQVLQNQAAGRDAERLQMAKEESNRKALEALQPKPISEFQQYTLDEKASKKEADHVDAISNINDTIDEFNNLKSIQAKTKTGPLASNPVTAAVRKMLPESVGGGENLQRLEQGYNTMAVKAISAFKAGGVTFGQLSNAEGKWIKDTTAELSKGGTVNQEILDHGLKLLNDRKERINKQAGSQGNISVDIKHPENMSAEDKKALESDIAKEKTKQKVLKFDANGNMVQ